MRALTITLCLLATPALADVAGVVSVIDGDTIEVHGQRIRLHGIDALESRQLCHLDSKPWQCGKEVANALAEKIARRPVTCEDLGRDRYNRILARCTVAGEDLGEWMVAQGWAVAYYQFLPPHEEARTRTCLSVFISSRQRAAPSATQNKGLSASETDRPVDARRT